MNRAETYRRYRREGYNAQGALARARQDEQGAPFELEDGKGTFERDGFTIRVEAIVDEIPDLSWVGEFSDTREEDSVPAPNHGQSGYFQWFTPTVSLSERRDGYRRMGYSRHSSYLRAKTEIIEDSRLAAELTEYVVFVTALKDDIELGQDVLGGMTFDDDADLAYQVEWNGMVDSAIEQAKEAIAKLTSV